MPLDQPSGSRVMLTERSTRSRPYAASTPRATKQPAGPAVDGLVLVRPTVRWRRREFQSDGVVSDVDSHDGAGVGVR